MGDLLEMLMIVIFGVSWPINCVKLWRSRTTKGVSPWFYVLVMLGYLLGIISKVLRLTLEADTTPFYVWFFYFLNFFMVGFCLLIYFRNRRIEKAAA